MEAGVSGTSMQEIETTARAERFMPDWIVGAALRWSLIPGLWVWGRAYAADWPDVVPSAVSAAQVCLVGRSASLDQRGRLWRSRFLPVRPRRRRHIGRRSDYGDVALGRALPPCRKRKVIDNDVLLMI